MIPNRVALSLQKSLLTILDIAITSSVVFTLRSMGVIDTVSRGSDVSCVLRQAEAGRGGGEKGGGARANRCQLGDGLAGETPPRDVNNPAHILGDGQCRMKSGWILHWNDGGAENDARGATESITKKM